MQEISHRVFSRKSCFYTSNHEWGVFMGLKSARILRILLKANLVRNEAKNQIVKSLTMAVHIDINVDTDIYIHGQFKYWMYIKSSIYNSHFVVKRFNSY